MTQTLGSGLSPQTWPFDWKLLPASAYLVGGAVRDGLLQRESEYLDLDFVLLEQAVDTAHRIANYYKAGFVLLDADRQIARVVFADATVDFAQAEGTLDTDLQRRDFTINAIAYHPMTATFIDPHQGIADLQQQMIRMISPQNLHDDPLRLLRGYRQAAQLQFTIEAQTQTCLRQFAPQLQQVAVERVQTELGYLLQTGDGTIWLRQCWEDGLISSWFPHGVENWTTLSNIDPVAAELGQMWLSLLAQLSQPLRETLKTSQLALVKLACLLTPVPTIAEAELTALKYSKVEIRAALKLINGLTQIQTFHPDNIPTQQLYFLFRDVGNLFPALAVWAIASGCAQEYMIPLLGRYFTPNDPVAHPTPLLSGTELMAALQLPPSPRIGQLLLELQLAQVEGFISTPETAIDWAKQWLIESEFE
ncbi:MAG: CCA tRNA nucleotidyltransferase [Microcoleaceae cyanobacterium]